MYLQAAVALAGAPLGPILALFILGIFCPWSNHIGAMTGLVLGMVSCFTMTIGAIIIKPPHLSLPTTTVGCTNYNNMTYEDSMISIESLQNQEVPHYSPEGLNNVFHIIPYLTPLVGFLITFFIGLIVSFLTGCNRGKELNSSLMNKYSYSIYNFYHPEDSQPTKRRPETHKLDIIS